MSERTYVLDASALLATLFGEDGADAVDAVIPDSVISAVNLAEVVTTLVDRGATDDEIADTIADLRIPVVPFDEAQAIQTGRLRAATRSCGLSLGDRSCLALAAARDAVAITMDRHWGRLTALPIPVRIARD